MNTLKNALIYTGTAAFLLFAAWITLTTDEDKRHNWLGAKIAAIVRSIMP